MKPVDLVVRGMIVGKTQTPPATALGNGEPVGPNAAAAASEGDIIARVVLEKYARLPANRRPQIRDNGVHEWVPLSGIVARGTLLRGQGY